MKIHFEPDLDFQREAVAAVVDLFRGQEVCSTAFTVQTVTKGQLALSIDPRASGVGVGNRLTLLPDDVLANLQKVQLRHGLPQSQALDRYDFTVEMETGTGKTYVYLRTAFELHRAYGFTKFIIVVPSIAIKEGVYKTLEMTTEHFRGLYANVGADYFVYDSSELGQVRRFATSTHIQLMVINIDAFRRSFADPELETKANIIHRAHDRMNGVRPIDLIRETNPIVIIDEPQTVDTTTKSKEAIASLNPLCTLRYSATHVDTHHQVYRLDAVDAYERKLVKQIEVASLDLEHDQNLAYVRLLKVDNKKTPITAEVELDVRGTNGKVERKKKKVKHGTDLQELTGRDVYRGYIVDDIRCVPGQEVLTFTSRAEVVRLGEAIGGVDEDQRKRQQIRKTIEEHLEKEMRLRDKGIKVLSLFFIDKVANYRRYDEDGTPLKGKYAQWFEEEYDRAIRQPKYSDLFLGLDLTTEPDGVHNGYFAVDSAKDKTGANRLKDSRGEGSTQADESAYQLIMRDKERLLSFQSKLKFIFSHSALREGWDNPNVFQICSLTETHSDIKRRQQLGRGLRICVDQAGQRVRDPGVNMLTVMANESFADFADNLQKEIEASTGIRFGVLPKHAFANLTITTEDGQLAQMGQETSQALWQHFKAIGYIAANDKVTDKLKKDLRDGKLELPPEHLPHADTIRKLVRKIAGDLNIKDANNRKKVGLNKAIALGEDFKALWDRIKHKTTFRVHFDSAELIAACAKQIDETLVVPAPRFVYTRDTLDIHRGGVVRVNDSRAVNTRTSYIQHEVVLPDIVGYLQNETQLTRRSIVAILKASNQLDAFTRNPQRFIEGVLTIIQHQMRLKLVDGIKYEKVGSFYAQELFESHELTGYLEQNLIESRKSPYDYVVYQSDVERTFADELERNERVKVYAKLPAWFTIPTPLGTYNPDWALLVEDSGGQSSRLYFVVESKSTTLEDALRPREVAKIACGRAHFEALGQDVTFTVADSVDGLVDRIDHTLAS